MARVGRRQPGDARLLARPGSPTGTITPGLHRLGLGLGLDGGRDALLSVPAGYQRERPAPFVLSLHGAGGNETSGLYPLHDLAGEAGLILLSPASRGGTWDAIRGGFGADIAFIERALVAVFDRCAVDPAHIAVAGFSDGGSYALSIGLANGDLFPAVMAFSPGFIVPSSQRGTPRFFVSHGTDDAVLPIDRTSRRLVPHLRDAGYDVRYREFDGGHTVPPEITRNGLSWFLEGSSFPSATPER